MDKNSAKYEVINMTDLQKQLFDLRDEKYKSFHAKLIPNIDPDKIIGIRTPVLRKFAKEFAKTPEADGFIKNLPHEYYEENNLHAFIIEGIKDYDKAIEETERFLPYIDNWATCDMYSPKIFKKNTDRLISNITQWINSSHPYTIRYAIGMLMSLYLGDNFKDEYPQLAASVHSEEYYVNMMIAWYFATALAKQYDRVISYFTQCKLDKWVHNKAIQKAVESSRILPETKAYLKTLKIK